VRTIVIATLVIFLLSIAWVGCQQTNQEVTVTVLVDVDSPAFKVVSHKLVVFGAEQHRTATHKSIAVQNMLMSTSHFKQYLVNRFGTTTGLAPDIVVLGSPEQADLSSITKREAAQARDVCGAVARCPAFIPSWVTGDKLEAAQQVFRALAAR
jgi:hypothetical protein